jgi:hypothetical protein
VKLPAVKLPALSLPSIANNMCCFIVCLAWLEAVVAVQQLKMANHFAKDDAIGDDNNCGVGIIFFGLDVDVP